MQLYRVGHVTQIAGRRNNDYVTTFHLINCLSRTHSLTAMHYRHAQCSCVVTITWLPGYTSNSKCLKNKKYVLWNVYLPNVVAFHTPLPKYFDCNCNDLELGGFRSSIVMVPIESPWVVSYLTSCECNITSLTVFEIFHIKDIFP